MTWPVYVPLASGRSDSVDHYQQKTMKPKTLCIRESYIFTALFTDKFPVTREVAVNCYILWPVGKNVLSEAILHSIGVVMIYR